MHYDIRHTGTLLNDMARVLMIPPLFQMKPLLQTLLFTLLLSVLVDPQAPNFQLATPRVRQALALANYLMRRPVGERSIRRDCRLIPQSDLDNIFNAIRRAKADTRLRPNVHDCFAFLHSHPQVNAGAHGGPGFLPWHRVFVFLYEKMLRMYEPTVSMCFWDSTLEPDNFAESSTWTEALFGNGNGPVTSGPGAGWTTPVGRLTRDAGQRGRPLNMADIENILSQGTLGEVSFPNGHVSSNVEEVHNHVHVHVGGHMGQIETAAYDPIFWFHHTFVDCIYEWFRDEQKSRGTVNVQRDWPRDWGESAHGPFRAMRLGSLRNIDGQNDFFSTRVLQCHRVPRCRTNADCGRHMTCEARSSRCTSTTRVTQSNNFFNGLMGMLGNIGQVGNLGNLGNMFGGNIGGFNQNNGPGAMNGFNTFRNPNQFGGPQQGNFGGPPGGQRNFGGQPGGPQFGIQGNPQFGPQGNQFGRPQGGNGFGGMGPMQGGPMQGGPMQGGPMPGGQGGNFGRGGGGQFGFGQFGK
ncbi:tyrosinase-like protein isoform X1 [Haliotis rubra]|uniref:tyrosinase-like protein isoform X1 n=2 Tax=Haliotis rubra TaxID=36100 RepID=UPI001EE6366A|nr:tyrosinase-like protein isoform X1 [Haliotis rubra]